MTTMAKTETVAVSSHKLELMTAYGSVFRDVLTTPPRDCDPSEVPVIDLSGIYGDIDARKALARAVGEAAENTGFFYIKNHGISKDIINAAYEQGQTFFTQPEEKKRLVSRSKSKFFNGWSTAMTGRISPTESLDNREGLGWRYDPQYDPDPKDLDAIPEEIRPWIRGEEFVWEGTSHIPNFKRDLITYWQECLKLARRMIRIFALALDLPETYFDSIVTYPGSDGVLNYYPKNAETGDATIDIGLGSHTDLQCFTFLWQDTIGGLQALKQDGQWIKVPPIPDTFIVNIGDFLMRLSNDRLRSTVHRVFNHAPVDRYSMPFFFGFNFNEKCGVLPSCMDENNPAKYEPITCGEWCQLRFEKGSGKASY